MDKEQSVFQQLNSVDVSKKVENKNGLSYLSWAWAWAELKKVCPMALYHVYENVSGLNYHHDGRTAWVKVGVQLDPGERATELIEMLPVMDFRNASIPVEKLTSTDVNKAIQRAVTKAIARHGLGLYIYAGEDLPEETGTPETKKAPAKSQPEFTKPKPVAPKPELKKLEPKPQPDPEEAEPVSQETPQEDVPPASQEGDAQEPEENVSQYIGMVVDVKKNAAKGTFIIDMDNGKKYYTKSEPLAVEVRNLIDKKACLSFEDKGAYYVATGVMPVIKE